jgi:hypothetical protein
MARRSRFLEVQFVWNLYGVGGRFQIVGDVPLGSGFPGFLFPAALFTMPLAQRLGAIVSPLPELILFLGNRFWIRFVGIDLNRLATLV